MGTFRPIHLFGKVLFRDSLVARLQCRGAPSCWRERFKTCHLRNSQQLMMGCTVELHEPPQQIRVYCSLCAPTSRRTLPRSWNGSVLLLWTVFQPSVLHIPDGNAFALELLISSTSITTQTLPSARGKMSFCVRMLCMFQQRHYRQSNELMRTIYSGTFEKCNAFPIPQNFVIYLSLKCVE